MPPPAGSDWCKVSYEEVLDNTERAVLIRFDSQRTRWVPRVTISATGDGWLLMRRWVIIDRDLVDLILAEPQRINTQQERSDSKEERSQTPPTTFEQTTLDQFF